MREHEMEKMSRISWSDYLESQGIHDNMIWNQTERVNFPHQYRGRNLVELDTLEEAGHHFAKVGGRRRGITVTLRPGQGGVELDKFISFEFLPGQN